MLPAPNRLRERADFTSAVRSSGGCRAGSRLLVVHATSTDARALVADRLPGIPSGLDLVVRANPPASTATFGELAGALDPLLHKVIGRLGGAP